VSTGTTNARALAAMLRRKSVYRKSPGYQIGIIELDCEDRDAIVAELERLADLEDGPCQCCGKACKCKEFAGELSDGA
jgi:hypothetical protein